MRRRFNARIYSTVVVYGGGRGTNGRILEVEQTDNITWEPDVAKTFLEKINY